MGKLNVTPNGSSSGISPGHAKHPSCITSAIHFPIQAKRSPALLFFNCSPIGHDFSRCLMTRDLSLDSEISPPSPFAI